MSAKDIKSMSLEEIVKDFERYFPQVYRAKQVYSWLGKGTTNFDEMTNISKDMRAFLKANYFIPYLKVKDKQVSSDGTIKYLFELHDKEYIESVLMKYKHGYSICISTQAGCKMGCAFCETGKSGFFRNLAPSEMLAQIELAQSDNNIKISNVVLMGMGEPLDNYENVLRFLELVSSKDNMNIGMRHISLSTCGIVDKIYDLAEKKLQLTLSISLHAPNDKIRDQIMKINRRWNVDELIKACKHYAKETGRRISFEYAMTSGLNDSVNCAFELANLLKTTLCHVNLIPLNASSSKSTFQKSSNNQIYKFKNILEKEGINATIRRTLGEDIEAACGQLRRRCTKQEDDTKYGILQ